MDMAAHRGGWLGAAIGAALPLLGSIQPAFAQLAFQESAGQVVMEGEHYDGAVSRQSKQWTFENSLSYEVGSGYMSVLPNTGATQNTGYVTNSPELIFNVQFTTTGTYYVWIRGSAGSPSDDSAHAGLDGTGPSTADRITGFGGSWTWKRTTMDSNAPATVSVATPGLHTIHIWMREDGLHVDRILLRTSSSSGAPSGGGPPESPRIELAPPDTQPPALSDIRASNITETAAEIAWTTDESATSQVEYGPTTSYGAQTPLDSTRVTAHRVALSGLSANTTSHYRVRSKDAAGNEAVSPDNALTTARPNLAPTGTVSINGGASATNTTTVTLTLSASDDSGTVAQMRFSNDNATYSAPEAYGTTKSWTLSAGDGDKSVWAQFADAAGKWSDPVSDAIRLDTTPPSVTITSPRDGEVIQPPGS